MAVDRATVLRQQQLFDQAMQAAGNNPVEAERLSRIAMMQSGLEYMYRKQQEEIEKGGREAEMALREGRIAMRAKDAAQRASLAREALREGQKIRNIGLALNVASTLGASAIPVIAEGISSQASKASALSESLMSKEGRLMAEASGLPRDLAAEKIKEAEGLRDVSKNLGILERGTEGLGINSYKSGSALQGVPPRNIRDREPMRALSPRGVGEVESISPDISLPRQTEEIDAYNEQADQLDDALDVISDQRGEETMRMIRGILERSPQASLPGQRSDRSMDDKIWRLINNNMGVA
jgi:hypothetical protein